MGRPHGVHEELAHFRGFVLVGLLLGRHLEKTVLKGKLIFIRVGVCACSHVFESVRLLVLVEQSPSVHELVLCRVAWISKEKIM